MEFEDVQEFIHEIRKRPALWDSNSEDYKNRWMKKDAWIEIYKIAFPDYLEKNEDEKKRIAKDIHMKWKNLRDAYIRHIRHATAMKTEKRSIRMKPYVYARQMDFLKEVINCRPTITSSGSTDRIEDTSNDSESMREIATNTEVEEADTPSTSVSYRKSRRHLEEKSIDYIDSRQKKQQKVLQSSHHELEEENDDMAFFRSLLPTLQTLRLEEKLTFRIEVMKLLTRYTNSQRGN